MPTEHTEPSFDPADKRFGELRPGDIVRRIQQGLDSDDLSTYMYLGTLLPEHESEVLQQADKVMGGYVAKGEVGWFTPFPIEPEFASVGDGMLHVVHIIRWKKYIFEKVEVTGVAEVR